MANCHDQRGGPDDRLAQFYVRFRALGSGGGIRAKVRPLRQIPTGPFVAAFLGLALPVGFAEIRDKTRLATLGPAVSFEQFPPASSRRAGWKFVCRKRIRRNKLAIPESLRTCSHASKTSAAGHEAREHRHEGACILSTSNGDNPHSTDGDCTIRDNRPRLQPSNGGFHRTGVEAMTQKLQQLDPTTADAADPVSEGRQIFRF